MIMNSTEQEQKTQDPLITDELIRIANALESIAETLKAQPRDEYKPKAKANNSTNTEILDGIVNDCFQTDKVIRYEVYVGTESVKAVIFASIFNKHPNLANYNKGDRIRVFGEWRDDDFRGQRQHQFIVRGPVEPTEERAEPDPKKSDELEDDVPF